MEKVIKKFSSFEKAQEADDNYYNSLTPNQRVDLVLEMQARYREGIEDEAAAGFSRVYRIAELS